MLGDEMNLPKITFWLLIIGTFIALPSSAVVYNKVSIALNANNYTRAVFVVSEVGVTRLPGEPLYRSAKGTIGGNRERMSLVGMNIHSSVYEELVHEVPAGTEIQVWYDPTMPDVLTQYRTLRVIPSTVDLQSAAKDAQITSAICLGPLVLGLLCLLICHSKGLSVTPRAK